MIAGLPWHPGSSRLLSNDGLRYLSGIREVIFRDIWGFCDFDVQIYPITNPDFKNRNTDCFAETTDHLSASRTS
jgi:hypothetical protein